MSNLSSVPCPPLSAWRASPSSNPEPSGTSPRVVYGHEMAVDSGQGSRNPGGARAYLALDDGRSGSTAAAVYVVLAK